jgi:hypothetical protein
MPSWRSIGNILLLLLVAVVAAYSAVSYYGLQNGTMELKEVREPLGYALTSVITLLAKALADLIAAKIAAAEKQAP